MLIDHGWWRVVLRDEPGRLLRLARTQLELARLLEVKVVAARHQLLKLEQTRAGILSALDRVEGSGLALYAGYLRRLMDIDVAAKARETEIAELNGALLKVRLRQEVLTRRAEMVRLTGERKAIEVEALDVSLSMYGKATGKQGVLR
jgi:hypothetical protein